VKEKPNLPSSERFRFALGYATTLHATQYRKGAGIPYISHLYSVATLVMEAGGSEDEVIGTLLHDGLQEINFQITYKPYCFTHLYDN
jgi:(p)ppGpp synthase/HD superfamily hydrolase